MAFFNGETSARFDVLAVLAAVGVWIASLMRRTVRIEIPQHFGGHRTSAMFGRVSRDHMLSYAGLPL
jgi:hypothetical protein